MKSDIEIAQEAELIHIREVAKQLGIAEDDLELYGKYKAKISDELWEQVKDREDGKLVLVTAINPTPAGEGKTTTSVGIGQAMAKLGKKAAIALREPSLGSMFWYKRRGSRWRICTGCTYGRLKSSFYWRFSCDNIGKQSFGSYA